MFEYAAAKSLSKKKNSDCAFYSKNRSYYFRKLFKFFLLGKKEKIKNKFQIKI